MSYAILKSDGSDLIVRPGSPSIDDLYYWIGCEIVELVPISPTLLMWVDEEGKLGNNNQQPNLKATLVAMTAGITDYIVGNVVFTGGADTDGEQMGLDDNRLRSLRTLDSLRVSVI